MVQPLKKEQIILCVSRVRTDFENTSIVALLSVGTTDDHTTYTYWLTNVFVKRAVAVTQCYPKLTSMYCGVVSQAISLFCCMVSAAENVLAPSLTRVWVASEILWLATNASRRTTGCRWKALSRVYNLCISTWHFYEYLSTSCLD